VVLEQYGNFVFVYLQSFDTFFYNVMQKWWNIKGMRWHLNIKDHGSETGCTGVVINLTEQKE
jgi:hypothetical protein